MSAIRSLEELKQIQENTKQEKQASASPGSVEVRVMLGTCGIAAGALDTLKTILEFIESENIHGVTVTKTGCMGLCEQEPMVQVKICDQPRIIYGKVNPEVAEKIMKQHVQYGQPVVENLMQLFS